MAVIQYISPPCCQCQWWTEPLDQLKTNLQWHQPKWQHQCSLKHFPWLCVAQMESPSQGRKSGLPAQLLAKACASSNFSLLAHLWAPEAAMTTFPGSAPSFELHRSPSEWSYHTVEDPAEVVTVHREAESRNLFQREGKTRTRKNALNLRLHDSCVRALRRRKNNNGTKGQIVSYSDRGTPVVAILGSLHPLLASWSSSVRRWRAYRTTARSWTSPHNGRSPRTRISGCGHTHTNRHTITKTTKALIL